MGQIPAAILDDVVHIDFLKQSLFKGLVLTCLAQSVSEGFQLEMTFPGDRLAWNDGIAGISYPKGSIIFRSHPANPQHLSCPVMEPSTTTKSTAIFSIPMAGLAFSVVGMSHVAKNTKQRSNAQRFKIHRI